MNQLHYGDNLDTLREHVADESVDLDPPFNRSYRDELEQSARYYDPRPGNRATLLQQGKQREK